MSRLKITVLKPIEAMRKLKRVSERKGPRLLPDLHHEEYICRRFAPFMTAIQLSAQLLPKHEADDVREMLRDILEALVRLVLSRYPSNLSLTIASASSSSRGGGDTTLVEVPTARFSRTPFGSCISALIRYLASKLNLPPMTLRSRSSLA